MCRYARLPLDKGALIPLLAFLALLVFATPVSAVPDTWSPAGSLATARYQHTATVLPSGKVLVASGLKSSNIPSTEVYDPATNNWTVAASLATARSSHTATLLLSGKLLVVGGNASGISLASAE